MTKFITRKKAIVIAQQLPPDLADTEENWQDVVLPTYDQPAITTYLKNNPRNIRKQAAGYKFRVVLRKVVDELLETVENQKEQPSCNHEQS